MHLVDRLDRQLGGLLGQETEVFPVSSRREWLAGQGELALGAIKPFASRPRDRTRRGHAKAPSPLGALCE
jgi:hypothetical protein